MKAQLTSLSVRFGANPNALKIVSAALLVSLTVIGLLVPSASVAAGPISGPPDIFR